MASLLAFGLVGCGGDGNKTGNPTGPVAPSPDPDKVYPPVLPQAKYNFYEPKDEEELKTHTNYGYLIAKTKPGFDVAKLEKMGIKVVSSFNASGGTYHYLHKAEGDVLTAMKNAKNISGLMYIEPDFLHYADDTWGPIEVEPEPYDNPDPCVERVEDSGINPAQYCVRITRTLDAWKEFGFGPHTAVVANIDTGVSYNHKDIEGNVLHAYTWYQENGTDLLPLPEGQLPTLPDALVDRPDAQFGTGHDGSSDRDDHGTHTCGTMVAVGNNGIGVAGMVWKNVALISYKGMSNAGSGGAWTIYGSIWHLANWKIENDYPYTIPVNLSLGSQFGSQFACDMVELGLENNILMVCSSGNSYAGSYSYPGSYQGALRVGSSNSLDRRSYFSCWGPDLSVLAPGENVMSLMQGNGEDVRSENGTSMASPHVAGLAGYMLTFNPYLKPDQIKTYIEKNADKVEGQTGFNPMFGHGRINTYNTIKAVIDDVNGDKVPPSDYVMSAVKINVTFFIDDEEQDVSDAIAYLYHCDENGTIENYAASSFVGWSLVDGALDDDGDSEYGVARFNMLKPGYYKVVVAQPYGFSLDALGNVFTTASASFLIDRDNAVEEIDLELSASPEWWYIQTYRTADITSGVNTNTTYGGAGSTDTIIHVYDGTGKNLLNYDIQSYDTLRILKPEKPGEYIIGVSAFMVSGAALLSGYYYYELGGDYALQVGPSLKPSPAPLSYNTCVANGGTIGTLSQSLAAPQAIELGDVIYGRLRSSSAGSTWVGGTRPAERRDYYKITIQ
jgi:subtilisin family serine protease